MMEPFLKVRYSIMAWYDTSNPWRACHELHVPSRFMQKKKNIIIIISSIYFRKSFDNNGIIIWKNWRNNYDNTIPKPNPILAPFYLVLIISLEWGCFRRKFFFLKWNLQNYDGTFSKSKIFHHGLGWHKQPMACMSWIACAAEIYTKKNIYIFFINK